MEALLLQVAAFMTQILLAPKPPAPTGPTLANTSVNGITEWKVYLLMILLLLFVGWMNARWNALIASLRQELSEQKETLSKHFLCCDKVPKTEISDYLLWKVKIAKAVNILSKEYKGKYSQYLYDNDHAKDDLP